MNVIVIVSYLIRAFGKTKTPKSSPGLQRRGCEGGAGRWAGVCVCARVCACVCVYKHTLFNSALIVSSGMEMSEFDAVKTSK